jgi:hypothetical protein
MDWMSIGKEFVYHLSQTGISKGFRVRNWIDNAGRAGSNIIELNGAVDCLIYYKVRSDEPYRWGVTKNRIDELNSSGKPWFVVLLYESSNTGYLIPASDVSRYLSIWPLGSDGDYKVAIGSYLKFNKPFSSFSEFVHLLMSLCK